MNRSPKTSALPNHPVVVDLPSTRTGWFRSHVLTTDHRAIGRLYLYLSLLSVGIGTVLSFLMRLHLTWPERVLPFHGPILPEDYLALVTIHGTLMLFFVLTTAPQSGFGNLILPSQIGARRMAFPLINAVSFWVVALALVALLSATFVSDGNPISGWTAYPPLSAVASAGPGQGLGMDLWLASIALFAVGSAMSATNLLVTVVQMRCEGMTWGRLPLTVWAWVTAAMLSILAFSVLLAALLLLFCDRHLGSGFYLPVGDLVNGTLRPNQAHNGSPLLWLHLFWFFGHPEVYIAILPGMGLTSMILANFCRKRVFAYRTMILTTLLIGSLGILVWGHHMFVAGLNPFAGTAFSVSTIAIAIPSAAKVLSWLVTIWRSRPRYTTAFLFALGFVSLFIAGGLTGPILAQPVLDEYLHNTFFVVAHFHLIMAMAGIFGLFAATYYWFPLLAERTLHEGLGRIHFWGSLVGAYATFLPMHLTGLMGEPRHYAQLSGIPNAAGKLLERSISINQEITWAAFFLAAVQVVFLANLVQTLLHRCSKLSNPWDATTLEWYSAPSSEDKSAPPIVYRGPSHYLHQQGYDIPLPQWIAPELPAIEVSQPGASEE